MSPLVASGAGIALVVLAVALVATSIRLVRGPHLADRVVALDLLAVVAIGVMACLAVTSNKPVLLDASLAVALLAFIGTVAFARYMERQA